LEDVYPLAKWMQHTIGTGKVITRRDTVVIIDRLIWKRNEKVNGPIVEETFCIGDVQKGINFNGCVPSNPRIRIQYDCALESVELFYELPVAHEAALLPLQLGRSPYPNTQGCPFNFVGDISVSEEGFLQCIIEFLDYDIDFYEADGSRAKWWVDLLDRLKRRDNFYEFTREGVGSKPFR
jgi:hypothetical protein